MKNILYIVIAGLILLVLWKFGIIDSTIALLGMFGIGAGSVVKQKKDDVKEKEKVINDILKDVDDLKKKDDELTKKHDKEVADSEEAGDDMSLDDLLDSANDRIRRNRTGRDLEE
jgi:uncharacterized protein YoxC